MAARPGRPDRRARATATPRSGSRRSPACSPVGPAGRAAAPRPRWRRETDPTQPRGPGAGRSACSATSRRRRPLGGARPGRDAAGAGPRRGARRPGDAPRPAGARRPGSRSSTTRRPPPRWSPGPCRRSAASGVLPAERPGRLPRPRRARRSAPRPCAALPTRKPLPDEVRAGGRRPARRPRRPRSARRRSRRSPRSGSARRSRGSLALAERGADRAEATRALAAMPDPRALPVYLAALSDREPRRPQGRRVGPAGDPRPGRRPTSKRGARTGRLDGPGRAGASSGS